MKRFNLIISTVCASALLASCASEGLTINSFDALRLDTITYIQGELTSRSNTMLTRVVQTPDEGGVELLPAKDITQQPVRHTVQNMSDWRNMINRRMSVKIGSAIYGNYSVDTDGKITSSMGPFFYTPAGAGGGSGTEIYVWYPSTGTVDIAGMTIFTKLNQDKFAEIESCDLIVGKGTVATANQPMHFFHKTAKVQVILNVNRVVTTGDKKDTIRYALNNVKFGGVRVRADYQVCGTPGVASDSDTLIVNTSYAPDTIIMYCHNEKRVVNIDGDGYSHDTLDCLFPPQATKAKLIVNIGNIDYTGEVNLQDYKEGGLYTIIANLTKLSSRSLQIYGERTTYAVGDYLCANSKGYLYAVARADLGNASDEGIIPVGVIFSTTTSAKDKAHGWTHGYAMALQEAATSVAWSTNTSEEVQMPEHRYTDWTLACQDLDGYEATHWITDNPNYSASTYPAFFAAVNYTCDPCALNDTIASSGWYLPTNGQWHLICTRFGGMGTATQVDGNGFTKYGVGLGQTLVTNLNSYLSPVNTYANYEIFVTTGCTERHWCSDERQADYGRTVCWYTDMEQAAEAMSADQKTSITSGRYHWYTRSVIAF